MECLQGIGSLRPDRFCRPVVTMGVFDGIHLGHQALIREAVDWAREDAGVSVVLTFDRHPEGVLRGVEPPCITSLAHRLVLIGDLGVDYAVVLGFDAAMAAMSAEAFVGQVLLGAVGAHGMVLGFDQRFGHGGLGDAALVGRLGIPVRTITAIQVDGRPISSTAIREAIMRCDLAAASAMLGRAVEVYGVVVPGDARGRTIGFPTANLDLHHESRPPRGVYAGAVEVGGRVHGALVNIGRRPTFEAKAPGRPAGREEMVEVHVLDMDQDLYGTALRVRILGRLRDERRFDGPEALATQIRADRERFRLEFAGHLVQ